jgi:hypothetical protein
MGWLFTKNKNSRPSHPRKRRAAKEMCEIDRVFSASDPHKTCRIYSFNKNP